MMFLGQELIYLVSVCMIVLIIRVTRSNTLHTKELFSYIIANLCIFFFLALVKCLKI